VPISLGFRYERNRPGSGDLRGTSRTWRSLIFGHPTEAVLVSDGEFAVELDPGWYRVRGTAFGSEVCGEFVVEVRPHEVTQADFVCTS
jgi:hypothetical protein